MGRGTSGRLRGPSGREEETPSGPFLARRPRPHGQTAVWPPPCREEETPAEAGGGRAGVGSRSFVIINNKCVIINNKSVCFPLCGAGGLCSQLRGARGRSAVQRLGVGSRRAARRARAASAVAGRGGEGPKSGGKAGVGQRSGGWRATGRRRRQSRRRRGGGEAIHAESFLLSCVSLYEAGQNIE